MGNLRVKDIMTKRLVVIKPDDSVVYAASLLAKHNFNGLPVIVGNDNILNGILTEYDLVSKSDILHLPTLIDILSNIYAYKKNQGLIKDDIKNLMTLKVKDVMNYDPLTIEEDAWVQEVLDLFAHHHRVNPIPVVDKDNKLVGIVSRFDLVKLLAYKKNDENIDSFIRNFGKRYPTKPEVYFLPWPVILLSLAIVGLVTVSVLAGIFTNP